jgi:hypothetical protein
MYIQKYKKSIHKINYFYLFIILSLIAIYSYKKSKTNITRNNKEVNSIENEEPEKRTRPQTGELDF